MKFTEFIKDNYGKMKKVYEQYRGDDDTDNSWEPEQAPPPPPPPKPKKKKEGEGKPEKEVKKFEVGDVLVLADTKKSAKLPQDAYEFLTTYKKFTVLKVTENGKLDLGCKISKNTPEGGKEVAFIFGPNRFELESKVKSGEGNIKPIEED